MLYPGLSLDCSVELQKLKKDQQLETCTFVQGEKQFKKKSQSTGQ